MSRIRKPTVIANPIANRYSAPAERIMEFTTPSGKGGLISIIEREDGTVHLDIYSLDAGISVSVGSARPEAGIPSQ